MMGDKQVPQVNPLLIVLVGALAAAGLPALGPVMTGSMLSVGLAAYGLYVLRSGQRAIGVMLLVAAVAIVAAVLLRG